MTLHNRYRDYNKDIEQSTLLPGFLSNFMFSSCLGAFKRFDGQECGFRLEHLPRIYDVYAFRHRKQLKILILLGGFQVTLSSFSVRWENLMRICV